MRTLPGYVKTPNLMGCTTGKISAGGPFLNGLSNGQADISGRCQSATKVVGG